MGASTDAGEVGTLAVSLPGLATRRVARTTVSPQCRTRPHRWEQHGEGRRHRRVRECNLQTKNVQVYIMPENEAWGMKLAVLILDPNTTTVKMLAVQLYDQLICNQNSETEIKHA